MTDTRSHVYANPTVPTDAPRPDVEAAVDQSGAGKTPLTARTAALIGVIAALVMVAAQLVWRVAPQSPAPAFAEQIVAAVARLTPLDTFATITETYGSAAKRTLFVSVILGILAAGAGAGILARAISRRVPFTGLKALALGALVTAAGLFLFVSLVIQPIGYYGVFGGDSRYASAIVTQTLSTFALWAVAWLAVVRLFRAGRGAVASDAVQDGDRTTRRSLLARGAVTATTATAAAATGVTTWRLIDPTPSVDSEQSRIAAAAIEEASAPRIAQNPVVGFDDPEMVLDALEADNRLTPRLTSIADFYNVSKNITDPSVSEDGWSLKVMGLVERELSFTLDELRERATTQEITTLCCISNELNGRLISTAEWQGFPLFRLLIEAGVKPEAIKLKLSAADDYQDSIFLDRALNPNTLIVVGMNGEPLPEKHGFPARLIVPGIFGMKNVKWLDEIELIEDDFQGYWQTRGWSDPAPTQIWGRIDTPRSNETVDAGEQTIAGMASAGDLGVSRVEVSLDNGETFQDAYVEPAINAPLTWVRWALPVDLDPGDYRIRIRATDGTGEVASEIERKPLPDGATGWPSRSFKVE